MSFTLFSPMYLAFLHGKMSQSKAPGSDGLEVVPNHSAPEVVTAEMAEERDAEMNRRSFDDLPEAVVSSSRSETEVRAHYSASSDQSLVHDEPAKENRHWDGTHRPPRRRAVWILVAMIFVLIAAGAVVGAVIGTQLAKKHNEQNDTTSNQVVASTPSSTVSISITTPTTVSNPTSSANVSSSSSVVSPFKARQNTGVALITANSGANRYAYQQLGNGSVIEIPYSNGNWSLSTASTITNSAIGGSPLAATSFTLNGQTYRVLTFIDTNQHVLLMNTTGDGSWTAPVEVAFGDIAVTSSPALSLCADTDILKGMRLYYSSHNNYIQELAYDFPSSTWNATAALVNANPKAGIACTISNGTEHLYYRNYTTIQQWRKDYGDADPKWTFSHRASRDYPIESASDIAVTTNGAGTDYIFYRTATPLDGFVRASFDGTSQEFTSYINLTSVPGGSMFAAAPASDGANGDVLLLSQPTGATDIVWATSSADGSKIISGLLN